jgi:hypothetical protein
MLLQLSGRAQGRIPGAATQHGGDCAFMHISALAANDIYVA